MAQFAAPDADIVDGAWLDETAGNTNLFNGLPPGTPGAPAAGDDATFIESEANPAASACAFGLATLSDPASSTGHIMRWRRKKDASGGGQIDLTTQLRMTYVSEGAQGTLIASKAEVDVSDVVANDSLTLSGGEADAITDYADLQVRFLVDQST